MIAYQRYVIIVVSSDPKRLGSIAERLSVLKSCKDFDVEFVCRRMEGNISVRLLSRIFEIILRLNNALRILVFPKHKARTVDLLLFSWLSGFAITQIVKKRGGFPKAIHTVEPDLSIARYCKINSIKFIYEINTSTQAYFRSLKEMGGKYSCLEINSFLMASQNNCINASDIIIVPSQFVLSQIPDSEKIKTRVIPYYVREFYLNPQNKIHNNLADGISVGFVGNLTANKGLNELNAIADELKDSNVKFKAYGRRYRNTLNLSNRIIEMGVQNRNNIYSQIDLIVSLSWGEGSTRVVYEAVNAGIPVLCSVESGTPFSNNENWIAEHSNTIYFASFIKNMNSDRSLLIKLAEKQKSIISVYTLQRYVNSVARVYLEYYEGV